MCEIDTFKTDIYSLVNDKSIYQPGRTLLFDDVAGVVVIGPLVVGRGASSCLYMGQAQPHTLAVQCSVVHTGTVITAHCIM